MTIKTIAGITTYGVEDIAQEIQANPITVRQWIREGKIQGKKIGREWVVTEDALRAFITGAQAGTAPAAPEIHPGQARVITEEILKQMERERGK